MDLRRIAAQMVGDGSDQMILVVGASRGVGQYLFSRYAEAGEAAYGTFNSTRVTGGRFIKTDVTSAREVENLRDTLVSKGLENLSIVYCAGVADNAFLHKSVVEEWRKAVEVNLIGVYHVARYFLPIMREQGFGRIIVLSSVVAQRGVRGTSAYASSKAGLWGLARTVALENGSKGITMNNINLGYAAIGMGETHISDEFRAELQNAIPTKRFCSPEEIFSAVEFLRNTEYMNGVSIDLSGGLV